MLLAWIASVIMQSSLAYGLWRLGRKDWWLLFLLVDIARSLLLLPLSYGTDAYWWVWMGTEPIMIFLRFMAVWEVVATTKEPSWIMTGILAAAFICSLSMLNSPYTWALAKRTSLLLQQLGVLMPLGILLGAKIGRAEMNQCLLWYLSLDATKAILEQFTKTRSAFDDLNILYLWGSVALLATFSIKSYLRVKGRLFHHE